MANTTLARRYATAIFNLAKEANAVERVGAELHVAHSALYDADDVRRYYLSPVFERTQKGAQLEQAFAGKLGDVALHSVLLLVRKRRESLLPEIVAEYDALALAASGREPLSIVSARALSETDLGALVARLERSYGKRFAVTASTDPGLLGGMRITMGDRRIDGSLSERLSELARDLSTTSHS